MSAPHLFFCLPCAAQLSSTTEVLSSALKSQWDAQHAVNLTNQDKVRAQPHAGRAPQPPPPPRSPTPCSLHSLRCPQLSAVLSRVDSVLDRTATALSSGQSTLQAADEAILHAQHKAATKRAQHHSHKRKGTAADRNDPPEAAPSTDSATSPPVLPPALPTPPAPVDPPQAEAPASPSPPPRQSRRPHRAPLPSPTSPTSQSTVHFDQPALGDKENLPLEVALTEAGVVAVEEGSRVVKAGVGVVGGEGKKRKLTNQATAGVAQAAVAAAQAGQRPALQAVGGLGGKGPLGLTSGAGGGGSAAVSVARPSLQPPRNLFMSFLQGANAMRAPKLKT